MAVSSSYGFKIMGEDGVSLNGKWPIFGFDINNLENAFRTTRITDTSNNPYYNSGNTAPSDSELTYRQDGDHRLGTGYKIKDGTVKKLITRYEHGYDYRPSGYFTITGTFRMSTSAIIEQIGSGDYYQEFYGGSFTRTGSRNNNTSMASYVALLPKMDEFKPYGWYDDYTVPGTPPGYGNAGDYIMGVVYGTNSSLNPDIVIPGGTRGNPFSYTSNRSIGDITNLQNAGMGSYISVEIDNKYVNIYKSYRWFDWYGRSNDFFNPSPYPSQWIYDVTDHIRLVTQTTGSVFDVNVYLTPHKLEEMIING